MIDRRQGRVLGDRRQDLKGRTKEDRTKELKSGGANGR
jgi:hypothetical protein